MKMFFIGKCPCLCDSELATIFIFYKRLGYKTFREYYTRESATLKQFFPGMPRYKGLMKLRNDANVLLMSLLGKKVNNCSKQSRNFYIDSMPLPTCKLVRSRTNVTFRQLSSYGYSSTGSFYGVKLHLVVNANKQLTAFAVLTGKIHDIRYLDPLTNGLKGRIAGDRGYIFSKVKDTLAERNLRIITRNRKNMLQQTISQKDLFIFTQTS